jgi:hypothetical protein
MLWQTEFGSIVSVLKQVWSLKANSMCPGARSDAVSTCGSVRKNDSHDGFQHRSAPLIEECRKMLNEIT